MSRSGLILVSRIGGGDDRGDTMISEVLSLSTK